MFKRFGIVATLAMLVSLPAQAGSLDIMGVQVPTETTVAGQKLVLNGTGVRKRFVFDVYVGALYVKNKTNDPQEIINQGGPYRVTMDLVRDVTEEDLQTAMNDGFHNNLSQGELQKHAAQIQQFASITQAGKKGEKATIDLIPGKGTVIRGHTGEILGTVPGDDFFHAVLKLWIGDNASDQNLRKKMLGLEKWEPKS